MTDFDINFTSNFGMNSQNFKQTFISLLNKCNKHKSLINLLNKSKSKLNNNDLNKLNTLLLELSDDDFFSFFIPSIRSLYNLRIDNDDKMINALYDLKTFLSLESDLIIIDHIIDFIKNDDYEYDLENFNLLSLINNIPPNKLNLFFDCNEYLNSIIE